MKLTATLLKFGEDTYPDPFGDVVTFTPDSLFTDDHQRVALLVNHDRNGPAVGYAERIWTEDDTVRGEFTLLDTPAGRQVAAELAAGVRWDVSVGVNPEQMSLTPREDVDPHPVFGQPVRATITLADLTETSLCLRGRMPSARVDAVSTDPESLEGDNA